MDIERLRQAVMDKRFILSANPGWRAGRACGLSDDETEQKTNDALTIILESIAELVVAYLIDARQSVTSEEVKSALCLFGHCDEAKAWPGAYYPENVKTAITALQAYQPWVPFSERLPTEEDADGNANVMCLFADNAIETWVWNEITEWNLDDARKERGFVGITHWRPMLPEPPKGG